MKILNITILFAVFIASPLHTAPEAIWKQKLSIVKEHVAQYTEKAWRGADQVYQQYKPTLSALQKTIQDYYLHALVIGTSLWATIKTYQHKKCDKIIAQLRQENKALLQTQCVSQTSPSKKYYPPAPPLDEQIKKYRETHRTLRTTYQN